MNQTVERILIVDDERQNIRLLAEYLREDYKIMAAKDGNTALNALKNQPLPDLILLDIMMPGMDGYEVIQKIKSAERTCHIPVIFITALDATDDETLGFDLGAVDYIIKPFKPAIVKARVRTHLQLKQKTDLLDRLASLDGLTNIPNRRSFDRTLKKEVRIAARNRLPLSLVLIDIDFFKHYNDHYGHTAGDACLKKVAAALERVVSRAGDVAARYGGEEFALILPDTGSSGAANIAGQALKAVAGLHIPHAASGVCDHVSISLGVATATVKNRVNYDAIDLIKQADTALYRAKADGRNRIAAASGNIEGEK